MSRSVRGLKHVGLPAVLASLYVALRAGARGLKQASLVYNSSMKRTDKFRQFVCAESDPIQHDGEYVLTTDGKKDFGEITTEMAQKIRRQTGKIRLRTGRHEGKPGDFGEKHIERPERLKQLNNNGYKNARDLVQDVAFSYEAIFKGDGSQIILSKQGTVTNTIIFVELTSIAGEDFYDVKTGFIARKNYLKNKTPLWVKPQSGV